MHAFEREHPYEPDADDAREHNEAFGETGTMEARWRARADAIERGARGMSQRRHSVWVSHIAIGRDRFVILLCHVQPSARDAQAGTMTL
jgi:hypothetical protein